MSEAPLHHAAFVPGKGRDQARLVLGKSPATTFFCGVHFVTPPLKFVVRGRRPHGNRGFA